MNFERADVHGDLYDECKRLMEYHIVLKMTDGSTMDGIIEKVEPDRIIMLVGEDVMDLEGDEDNQERQFGKHRRFRRFRRFRRRSFPFNLVKGVFVLPFPHLFFPF